MTGRNSSDIANAPIQGRAWWIAAWIVSAAVASTALAGEIGVRAGIPATDKDEEFEQYEFYYTHDLSWQLTVWGDLTAATYLDTAAGALLTNHESAVIVSVGPILSITTPQLPVSIAIGVSPTFISQDELGVQDFGGQFQFISHAGLFLKAPHDLRVGYRFQHMSNASTREPNPGLNLHTLTVGMMF